MWRELVFDSRLCVFARYRKRKRQGSVKLAEEETERGTVCACQHVCVSLSACVCEKQSESE